MSLLTLAGLLVLFGLIYGFTSGTFAEVLGEDRSRGYPLEADSPSSASWASDPVVVQARKEYAAFAADLRDADRRGKPFAGDEYSRQGHAWPRRQPAELFTFDPNTADSATLCQLGLPTWMASNVLKYRRAGGHFRQAQDFRRIYGMTDEQYLALEPYIQIVATEAMAPATPQLLRAELPEADVDSAASTRPLPKYAPGTLVDLNRTDTTELRRIPGIGSGIAAAIVSYRERLGGYYCIGQLHEIAFSGDRRLDTTQLAPWFTINPTAIRRLDLNRADADRLRRHPYINFYQAKAIVEARRRDGRITSLRILSLLDEFTADDLARLAPYVSFGDTSSASE